MAICHGTTEESTRRPLTIRVTMSTLLSFSDWHEAIARHKTTGKGRSICCCQSKPVPVSNSECWKQLILSGGKCLIHYDDTMTMSQQGCQLYVVDPFKPKLLELPLCSDPH